MCVRFKLGDKIGAINRSISAHFCSLNPHSLPRAKDSGKTTLPEGEGHPSVISGIQFQKGHLQHLDFPSPLPEALSAFIWLCSNAFGVCNKGLKYPAAWNRWTWPKPCIAAVLVFGVRESKMVSAGQIYFQRLWTDKRWGSSSPAISEGADKPLAWKVSGHLFDRGFTEHRNHSKNHPK